MCAANTWHFGSYQRIAWLRFSGDCILSSLRWSIVSSQPAVRS
jgi:hypothetical protein